MVHVNLPFISVGPTVYEPDAVIVSVGPTVRIISVHRFAASLPPAGPPTPLRVRWWLRSRLTQMSVDQFFHELDAFELHKLHIPFDAAVQGHADLPWP